MPEGMEKQVDPAAMADLLAYLCAIPLGAPVAECVSPESRRAFVRLERLRDDRPGYRRSPRNVAAAPLPSGHYVDVHTHLGQTWNHTQPLSAAELFDWMDANDVAQAVVLPLISPESSSYPLTTDFVLAGDAGRIATG